MRELRGSLQAQVQQDHGEHEDHGRDDRQAVEVALDDGRPGHGTAELTTPEHVRQTATPPGVQEDEHDEHQGGDHGEHDEGGVDDHGPRLYFLFGAFRRRGPSRGYRYLMMRAKSSASRLAPPTSAPSMSGLAMSSATLPGFTL